MIEQGGLKMSKKIKDSVDKIREECDNIEDEDDEDEEDKNGKTRGDPVCELW